MTGKALSRFECLLCGSRDCSFVCKYRLHDKQHKQLARGRRIVSCDNCKLSQIFPVPDDSELASFYEHDYRSSGFATPKDFSGFPYNHGLYLSRGRSIRKLLDRYGHTDDQSKIIEIGAGFGYNLAAIREKYACTLVANEGDACCEEYLRRLNIELVDGFWGGEPVRDECQSYGPYDAAILSHVLEHPNDPVRFLGSLRGMMRSSGIVIIEVPNCPIGRIRRMRHSPHITFFTGDTLGELIGACSGDVLFLDTCGPVVRGRMTSPAVRRLKSRVKAALHLSWIGRSRRLHGRDVDDIDRVPLSTYDEYGGNRWFLRAVFRFRS
jgi:SAM-dependent methyltransferase